MAGTEQDLEALGDEITSLAAHLSAGTCRWLELIGEFDEREGWAAWGCRSMAHWVGWRCAIEPSAAREHVRVARRLRGLPLTREAFARGELSYSKVRAVTRIEQVEREEELLELARTATASQLERIVRSFRRVTTADAVRQHERRYLSVSHDDDGSMILRGRLSAEDGALLAKALDVAREQLGPTAGASLEHPAVEGDDAVPARVGPSGRTDEAGTPAVAARAAVDLGAANVDALVALADMALRASASAHGRPSADRLQVVVHVDADALRRDDHDHDHTGADADADASGDLPPSSTGGCELEDGTPVAPETARRLCCDASLVTMLERDGRTLSVGRKTRTIPPALQRALRRRDGGCRLPGCTQHRWVDAHHIEHWAHGGETKLSNLVQLCRFHHRLLHEGGFTVERLLGDAARSGGLVFRRPDGRRLHAAPRPPNGDDADVRDDHARRGLRVTPTTIVPRWCGERLDLPAAVDAVLACAGGGADAG